MTHYIETKAKDGALIRIEVEDTSKPAPGFTRHTPNANLSGESAAGVYNEILQTIQGCANGVIDTVQNLEALPSSASFDFAIKVDAEAGALVAKSREDAQFRVSLTWKQPEADKENGEEK